MLGQVASGDRRRRRHDRRGRPRRRSTAATRVRDITVDARRAPTHWRRDRRRGRRASTARSVLDITDRTFELHRRRQDRAAQQACRCKTRDDLSMAYTPGVARVCKAIDGDPDKAFQYTIKRNTVAVVSDGTAVLGLGDIGPRGRDAGDGGQGDAVQGVRRRRRLPDLPRHEGPGRDRRDREARSRPTFGGINLEDISAPRCFEIEERLKEALDIPVFHDDQHGTAVVVLAALLNALKLTGQPHRGPARARSSALGAAGVAVTKILLQRRRAPTSIGCDSRGARPHRAAPTTVDGSMNAIKRWFAETTNPERRQRRPRAT